MAWFAALGSVMNAANQRQQGADAQRAGEYNARLNEQEAAVESSKAARDEEALRRQQASQRSTQRAAIAQAGGGSGGSTGLLVDQSDAAAELDALNVRYGGQMRSMGLLSQAAMSRMSGANAQRQSNLMAGGTLLRGASDAYSHYRLTQ